ncbi:MAG: hypothetical protein ACQGVK_07710 [Myxococcota bacterium]
MACRPLTFGARFKDKGRTVRVVGSPRDPSRYTVEVSRKGGKTRRTEHGSLPSALRDFAQAWRDRLN